MRAVFIRATLTPSASTFFPTTPKSLGRQLNLENEYLFCRVLPDLGGHLYSCRDKINGQEMFYANPVIHKNWVGLRGAWAPVGIELNFSGWPQPYNSVGLVELWNPAAPRRRGRNMGVRHRSPDPGWSGRVEWILRPGSAILEEQVCSSIAVTCDNRTTSGRRPRKTIQDQSSGFQYPMRVVGDPRIHRSRYVAGEPGGRRYECHPEVHGAGGAVCLRVQRNLSSGRIIRHPDGHGHFADPAAIGRAKTIIPGDRTATPTLRGRLTRLSFLHRDPEWDHSKPGNPTLVGSSTSQPLH